MFQFEWHSKYAHLYNNNNTETLRIAHFILIVCFIYFYLVYNQERIDQNKWDWYFNAISLIEFSQIELFSNARQIISFPNPVVTFCIFILLEECPCQEMILS